MLGECGHEIDHKGTSRLCLACQRSKDRRDSDARAGLIPFMWSTETPAGHLLWTVDQVRTLPPACALCGAPIGGDPFRIECSNGHRWRNLLDELEDRLTRRGS